MRVPGLNALRALCTFKERSLRIWPAPAQAPCTGSLMIWPLALAGRTRPFDREESPAGRGPCRAPGRSGRSAAGHRPRHRCRCTASQVIDPGTDIVACLPLKASSSVTARVVAQIRTTRVPRLLAPAALPPMKSPKRSSNTSENAPSRNRRRADRAGRRPSRRKTRRDQTDRRRPSSGRPSGCRRPR